MKLPTLQERLARALVAHASTDASIEPHLRDALEQSTGTPGGLLRAGLAYEGAVAHGWSGRRALALACALEYFHVASLLLDDLPCMDDAAVRRGRPCVHRVHGDATAILAALSLISRAYALLGETLAAAPSPAALACHRLVEEALGAHGLAGGQAADLRFAEGPRDARAAARVALRKTGGLFLAALLLPALAARATRAELRNLRALATYWSLAYQAYDDLRDLLANEATTGKTVGRDRRLMRPNVALALGVPAARVRVARLVRLVDGCLDRLEADGAPCAHLRRLQRTVFQVAAATETTAAA